MTEIKVPHKRNFDAPTPERNFFADAGTSASQEAIKKDGEPPELPAKNDSAVVGVFSVPKNPASAPQMEKPAASTDQKPFEKSVEGLPTLRTYRQDVAGVMHDQKTSLVQLVLAEQRERRKRERETSPTSRKNLPLIILSVVFLIAAVGTVYYLFFILAPANTTLEDMRVTPLVFSEKNTEISVSNKDKKTLNKEVSSAIENKDLRLDAIEYVFFTDITPTQTPKGVVQQKTLISSNKFFELFDLELPSIILRSLRPEFMFGVHAFNKNQPFLILKTDYYDNAFAGMLEWEDSAPSDLLPLFDQSEQVPELSQRKWGDLVIKNKDTRVLRNFDDSIALVYMFKDQRTLIITTNEDTLLEVSRRLDTAQEKSMK